MGCVGFGLGIIYVSLIENVFCLVGDAEGIEGFVGIDSQLT